MLRWRLLAIVLTGCSEYDFHGRTDEPGTPGGETDAPETPSEDGDCAPFELPATTTAVDESCEIVAEVGTFTPVVEWRSTVPGDVYTTPVVGQLTDDNEDGVIDEHDMPDIIAAGYSTGTLYAFSGDGSGIHWQRSGPGNEPSAPAIADLDGDSKPDLVVSAHGKVAAYRGEDGTQLWSVSNSMGALASCGGVGAYDLDGDGEIEVVLGNLIYDGRTGTLRGQGSGGVGSGQAWGYAAMGVAADIDADGDLEVVVGNALFDADGNTIWNNGESDGFVAVANFDDDEKGEIVVTANPGDIRLQDDDGTVLWRKDYTNAYIGPPTIADFDGDGEPEIGVAGKNNYMVLETDGSKKWQNTVQDHSSGYTGSSVFDFEGDGKAEVVYADERDVWVFDGTTGAVKLQETQHSSATAAEYPVVADVDNDGHAEIVFASGAYDAGSERGITVIGDADDSWMAGRKIWNQHAYAITNVDGVGIVPTVPEPNWPTFNNFRSGDVSALTGSKSGDAVPLDGEVCTMDCDEGHLRIAVRLGNGGMDELAAGTWISAYAKDGTNWVFLSSIQVTDPLVPGETTSGVEFDLDPASVPEGEVRIVVDDDGTGASSIDECHEDNNILQLDASCAS